MDSEKAKKTIEQIFNLLGLSAEEVSYVFDDKRGHVFSIKSAEFEKVSSEREDLDRDLAYLLKRIFSKGSLSSEENFKCTIDINDRQSKADDKIKIKAIKAAEEAKSLKSDVIMDPMSSYERMVVHSTLAGYPDISTESTGIGKERKVKVKYLSI
jgi:spoIIIJ-associated protein